MSDKDKQILVKIIRHITVVLDYCNGKTFKDFNEDTMLHEACIFNMLQIGELANHLSESFVADNSDVPWKMIIGMRNRLVHDYDGVRLKIVWDTISCDFAPLITKIEKL